MGKMISGYVFPHPPIIVPEVGRGQEKPASKTVAACIQAARDIKKDRPTTIILTSPHLAFFSDYIYIPGKERIKGDLRNFGAKNIAVDYENNLELRSRIIKNASALGIQAGEIRDDVKVRGGMMETLDHGSLVPLYFIQNEYRDFKLVCISIAGYPLKELYAFGKCIQDAVKDSEERVVFVASGDLSHRLSEASHYGYSPQGKVFDDLFIRSIETMDVNALLAVDENLCEEAGECGLRSFLIMFGALQGFNVQSALYSYEGPFGIGYGVARLKAD